METAYSSIRDTILLALREDLGPGDITSRLLIAENAIAGAVFRAKEPFVLAGMPFVEEVFRVAAPGAKLIRLSKEGSTVESGTILAEVTGDARGLLAAERTALNILQRVSGIATLTRAFVCEIGELPARIADTRKTVPGMRFMEKYGVRMGGGTNHRFGLFDGILIKDNHIKAAGSVTEAVRLARGGHHLLKIEIEVATFDQLIEATDAGADVIMLDNMSIEAMTEAVGIISRRCGAHRPLIEASGSVGLHNVRKIAATGVDIISAGSLTHSARAVDISMKLV